MNRIAYAAGWLSLEWKNTVIPVRGLGRDGVEYGLDDRVGHDHLFPLKDKAKIDAAYQRFTDSLPAQARKTVADLSKGSALIGPLLCGAAPREEGNHAAILGL